MTSITDKVSNMRTRQINLAVLLIVAAVSVLGCNRTSSATNANTGTPENANAANPQNVQARAGESPKPAEAPATAAPTAPQLAGAYVMSEVHDKGVVSIISELKTVITFAGDGTYKRISSKGGKVYHTDSGTYLIDGLDKLVLAIQISQAGMERKLHNTPIRRTHKFTLSSNGEELRMISDDGKVALFRRTDQP
jgi:hypothetical protein